MFAPKYIFPSNREAARTLSIEANEIRRIAGFFRCSVFGISFSKASVSGSSRDSDEELTGFSGLEELCAALIFSLTLPSRSRRDSAPSSLSGVPDGKNLHPAPEEVRI